MQGSKFRTLFLAMLLGVAGAAGAQTYAAPATGDTNDADATVPIPQPVLPSQSLVPSTGTTVFIVVPEVDATGVDRSADMKCRNVAVGSYWDCVNSHNAGQ